MHARRSVAFVVLLVLCGFAAGLVVVGRMRSEEASAGQATARQKPVTVAAPAPAAAPSSDSPLSLPDFSRVAERTIPAVVNVSSQQVLRRQNSPYLTDPLLQWFLDEQGLGSRGSVENSLGSGVVVAADGYILTNNHVVTGERRRVSLQDIDITVTFADKRELPATVIGTDPDTDLALLKVDARNLPVMPWGDSQRLKVAEWVLAIGNPYQLSETVTLGIVSAVNRKDVGINNFEDFIQTDAAINPGNSGGALVNARGELVGINTAIFSQSGGYQGIGFAVASHLARRVMNDLRQFGEVRRGEMRTMRLVAMTTRFAAQLNAPDTRGVLVWEVGRGSSAERAGFQRGDILLSFNGTEINDGRQLMQLVADAPIGSTARVGVLRNGRRIDLRIPIEQQSARG